METQKIYKTVYEIIGKTRVGNFVCSGWFADEKGALDSFVREYPRFKGRAILQKKQVEVFGNGILISDCAKPGEHLCIFSSRHDNELLQYVNGRFVIGKQ
jgi:hypothetical protein